MISTLNSCAKNKESIYEPSKLLDPYNLYNEGLDAMNNGDYFFAARKFSEAEKILPIVEHSAKSLLMSSYCFYVLNFYSNFAI